MNQSYLLNVLLLILAYLRRAAGLRLQVWKLLFPIAQRALIESKHFSYFLDGIVALQILIQVQCHINQSYSFAAFSASIALILSRTS